MDNNYSYECECGLEKVFGAATNLPHSDYCVKYRPKYNLDCNCGLGGWHSPNCINYVPKIEPKPERIPTFKDVESILNSLKK